jgi:hypothetical protein
MWDELGEFRLRLDILEQATTDTGPLVKKLREINEGIERLANPATIEPTFLNPFTLLVHQLQRQFSIEELEALAYDAGIRMEHVGGSTLPEMCRLLVEYASRRNKLLELVVQAGEHRPPPAQWAELL